MFGCSGLAHVNYNGFQSAMTRTRGIAEHVGRFFKSADGRDKVLKLSDTLFDIALVSAEAGGASQSTLQGLAKGRAFAKAGRDANGLFNIFAGILPALVDNATNIYSLTATLCSPSAEGASLRKIKLAGVKLKPDDSLNVGEAVGNKEIVLALVTNLGKGIAALAYILAFGACRPLANVKKYCGADIGPSGEKVANSFAYVMMINHIGALISSFADIAFLISVRDRSLDEDFNDEEKIYATFERKMVENTITILEKFAELLMDINHCMGGAAPIWFRAPTGLLIGTMSCLKIARATA